MNEPSKQLELESSIQLEAESSAPLVEADNKVEMFISDEELKELAEASKNKEEAAAWLSDPKNRDGARLLAKSIQEVMGRSWFTLDRIVKKTVKETRQTMFAKLSLCGQFGFMARKQQGKDTLFKVALSTEDWILIVQVMISEHEGPLKALRHELNKLNAKLALEQEKATRGLVAPVDPQS